MASSPAAAILGPRQYGKSTLAKRWIGDSDAVYLDLQDRADRAWLVEPELFFEHHRTRLVCLDEIQRVPELFPALRPEIDRDRRPGRFLILGSASRDLILGGGVVKKRVGLAGQGKRGGARILVATNKDDVWFFVFGFEKNERANISAEEKEALQDLAQDLLGQTPQQLDAAVADGALQEICHDHED